MRICKNGLVFDIFSHVYPPGTDTFLLLEHLDAGKSDTVLELGVGCGLIALCLAKKAKAVVGVDVNPYAIKNAQHNAKMSGLYNARFVCGDLYEPVYKMRFDLICANPPYVPTPPDWIERDIIETAWNAGCDGRKVLDRILADAKEHLRENGRLVLVQSSLADISETMDVLEGSGFQTRILAEEKERLGPISLGRYLWLKEIGLLEDNPYYERLFVVEGWLDGK